MPRGARCCLPFLLALACLMGCHPSRGGRVLLIGVDGADPDVVERLFGEERLPNLRRIADQGAWGVARSHRPLLSPRIWNSIATGKNPKKHGIFSFAGRDADGAQRLYLSIHRRSTPLWRIVSQSGGTVGVVNWWTTYPPEEVNGVMISDHFLPGQTERLRKFLRAKEHAIAAPLVFPPTWSERARHVLARYEPPQREASLFRNGLPDWMDTDALERQVRDDGAITQLALEVEAEIDPDLLMVFLPGIDRVSHRLWASLEPPESYPKSLRLSEEERRAAASALLGYYEYSDSLVGLLASRFGPRDLVLVVSDHGFEAGTAGISLGVHRTEKAIDGVVFLRGPGIAAGVGARGADGPFSVNDVTPTILAWLGLPIAEDMDGRPTPLLEVEPRPAIATYDGPPAKTLEGASFGAQDEILVRLKELGYFE